MAGLDFNIKKHWVGFLYAPTPSCIAFLSLAVLVNRALYEKGTRRGKG